MHPLDGPHLKIARAESHLEAVQAVIERFFDSEPYTFDGRFNDEGTNYMLRVKVAAVPPIDLGLMIGDFANNARSALDHLVFELARINKVNPGGTQFPIFTSSNDYRKRAARYLDGVSSRHRALIEAEQPYHDREPNDDPLAWLADINNADKHRIIHVAVTWHHQIDIGVSPTGPEGMKIDVLTFGSGPVEDNAPIAMLHFSQPAPPDMEVALRPTFGVSFSAESKLVIGREVSGTLDQILARVRFVVSKFDGEFPDPHEASPSPDVP